NTTSTPSAPMGARAVMARTVIFPTGSREPGAGYTLIELMVVLLILGAATSLALPRLESFLPQIKFRQTAREVVLALREAQRQAIRSGLQTTVELDLGHRLLRGPGAEALALDPRFSLQLTSAAADEGEASRIDFFPDGTSTGGRLSLAYGGRRYRVTV